MFWLTLSIKCFCFLLIYHLGLLEDALLYQNDNQHSKKDSNGYKNSSTISFISPTNTNDVSNNNNNKGVTNTIKDTEVNSLSTNNSFTQSTGLRISSRYPIIDNEEKSDTTKKSTIPNLQKVQGQYIETGGGYKFGFLRRKNDEVSSPEIITLDRIPSAETIESITQDPVSQR